MIVKSCDMHKVWESSLNLSVVPYTLLFSFLNLFILIISILFLSLTFKVFFGS